MSVAPLPDPLPIPPRTRLDIRLRPPGSRSITNRALLVAGLARGDSTLRGVGWSDDTAAMRDGLEALGVALAEPEPGVVQVRGRAGRLAAPARTLDVRASGTTARFLTAAATLAAGPVRIDGSPRMRERPIADLVRALVALGAKGEVLGSAGCPPVQMQGGGLPGGRAEVDARRSSQYVSAILLAAPCAAQDVELRFVAGQLVSRPFLDLTLAVMRDFGAEVALLADAAGVRVRGAAGYRGRDYAIEPDAQSAVYPWVAAALCGGRARVEGLPGDSQQTDLAVLPTLEAMGCRVHREADAITVEGPREGRLRGVSVDMNATPDAVLAIAVAALFAEGPTRIRNVANLRIKETDRLAALERELGRLGARARADEDGIAIEPGPLHGAEVETYDDHRMAMSFALAGLRLPGVAIRDPGCVAKTWPDFFQELARW